MNFLLHHALARRDLDDGVAAVGAMLPDIWRLADPRARPARIPVTSDLPRIRALLVGMDHHAQADRAFHGGAPFAEGERALAGDLSAIGAPKVALFAHVGWEIALDGALIRREGLARVLARVRADIAEVAADDALDQVARLHQVARGREVPPPLASRVARVTGEIARGPWIEGYASPAGLAARLEGVRARFALPALVGPQRAALVGALEAALARADAALDAVLAMRVPPLAP